MNRKTFEVPPEYDGVRADRVTAAVAGISRALARRLVESGDAVFDGDVVGVRDPIRSGAMLSVALPDPEPLLVPEDVPFVVRYEDEHLAVVDKPAGIVVHPGAGRRRGTLAAGILQRWPQVRGVGDEGRWGIVHRLDRDTSGLLAVALDLAALTGLRARLSDRSLERVYLALVHGPVGAPTGTVDAPLARDPRRPERFRVDREGRHARTHYRLLASWADPEVALLEVRLETGRTHQIRVHLASIGHPVAGDAVYGKRDRTVPRQFLHAVRLSFRHPVTEAGIVVAAPWPDDLAAALGTLGEPADGVVPAV
jgi:23S rRNA pseudouridine1911/1915/1917 synthase